MADANETEPQRRAALMYSARALAKTLDKVLTAEQGKRVGFALFLFDFGAKGSLAYISNSDRDGMISTVKEWLARQEAGLESDPAGPQAES